MKKTFNVDAQLFKEARLACGATTDTETVRLGLEALVPTRLTSAFGLCAVQSLAHAMCPGVVKGRRPNER